MLRICVAALAFAFVIAEAYAPGAVSAASDDAGAITSKEEVVYAVLSGAGAPEAAYIVNSFRPSAAGEFTDYGDYTKATPLSSVKDVTLDGDAVTFALDDGPFSYQGDMKDPALPWLVNVGYRLDGRTVTAGELAGASGALEIRITTAQDPAMDRAYYDNYLMQITVTLDGEKCSDISAPDASVAAAGSDKAIAFTALPGKDADCTVKANVTDFEMGGIQFAALPFTMAFDLPDTDEMTGDMDELVDAVGELDDGTGKLSDGVSELDEGVREFKGGAKKMNKGAAKLAKGSSDFAEGLKTLDAGSPDLVSGSAVIGGGLKQMSDAAAQFAGGIDLSGLFAMLPGFDQTPSGAAVIAQMNALNEGLAGMSAGLGALSQNYSSFHDGLVSYTDGVGKLSANYGKLDKAFSSLTDGISEMADGAADLRKGTSKLADGASELHDGTSELYDGVEDLPDKVKEEIDKFAEEYDKSGYEPRSFASPKNKDVSLVQFIFRTAPIEKPEEPKPAAETPKETTFLSRLLSLFGIE
jgi:X-X-X-Leu-X-X-Gly heptad repeat protein